MKAIWILLATVSLLGAAPPSCTTKPSDTTPFENCERADLECAVMPAPTAMILEQLKSPSDKWNGCHPVFISVSSSKFGGSLTLFLVHVTIVPSYVDSEKVDFLVTVEKPDGTQTVFTSKDTPVIVRDGIPMASCDFVTSVRPYGVPTVEALEKGGPKSARHVYK